LGGGTLPYGRYLFVAHDVRGYSTLTAPHQHKLQEDLSEIIARAAARAGLNRDLWHRQSRGDGEVAALPSEEPEMRVLDDYPRHLGYVLRLYNENRRPERRMRVRMALHHGTAEGAALGFAGESTVAVCRIVDSDAAHNALQQANGDLITIVSGSLFEQTIGQGLSTTQAARYTRVSVSSKEYNKWAYIYCPPESVQLDNSLSDKNTRALIDEPETQNRIGDGAGGVASRKPAEPDKENQRESMVVNNHIEELTAKKAVFGFEAGAQ
jgi:hypothetical protein